MLKELWDLVNLIRELGTFPNYPSIARTIHTHVPFRGFW